MASPQTERQTACYTQLTTDAAVVAAIIANDEGVRPLDDLIFDKVDEKALFPYLTFSGVTTDEDDADCITGELDTFQVSVWSRSQAGWDECFDIAFAVKQSLHLFSVDLPTHALGSMRWLQTVYQKDPDGITRQAIVKFQSALEVK